jgi:uncharacterized protein (TIGR03067 family)
MKPCLALIGMACLLIAADKEDAAKEELKKLEGTWECTATELGGQKVPDALFKDTTLTVKGNSYTVKFKGKVTDEGTIKIDPTKTPKTIDMGSSKYSGIKDFGVYELDGNTLRICSARNERPKEFTTKKGTFMSLVTYQRKK